MITTTKKKADITKVKAIPNKPSPMSHRRAAEPTPCRRPMIIVIASAAHFRNKAPIGGERVCIRGG